MPSATCSSYRVVSYGKSESNQGHKDFRCGVFRFLNRVAKISIDPTMKAVLSRLRSSCIVIICFELTKSRIQHVECHSVTLFRTGDGNKALVAVVLRLVDLNDTTAHLSDLVDLLTALTNNGTDHVVGDKYLLS